MNELIAWTPLIMLIPSPIECPEWPVIVLPPGFVLLPGSEGWSMEWKIGSVRWKRGKRGSASPEAARASLARVASVRPSSAAIALASPKSPPPPPPAPGPCSLARSTWERIDAQLR